MNSVVALVRSSQQGDQIVHHPAVFWIGHEGIQLLLQCRALFRRAALHSAEDREHAAFHNELLARRLGQYGGELLGQGFESIGVRGG